MFCLSKSEIALRLYQMYDSESVQENWWHGVKPYTSHVQSALSRNLEDYFLGGVSATVASLT